MSFSALLSHIVFPLILLYPRVFGTEISYANVSSFASPFGAVISISSRGLDFSPLERDTLEGLGKRQTRQCEIPGGPICDAVHCCAPGQQCCPGGCCPLSSNCASVGRCCPKVNTLCPNGVTCCPPGYSCCGNTCCAAGFTCERGECIDSTLKDKVVRFDIKKNNRELLKNMCNGLRGKNTETLTYRGPDLNERDRTRVAAGCVDGYCADLIARGLVTSNFRSCDEYPPASSLEGGASRLPIQRAINCIPIRENSHQGGKFGGMQSKLRKLGVNFQRGDKFVVSIDCDKVLGSLVPRSGSASSEEVNEKGQHLEESRLYGTLQARDGEKIAMSGNETVDPDLAGLFDDAERFGYLLAAFGDLKPGTYSAKIQVVNGSTFGGFVVDNEGWNYTTRDSGAQAGQSQEYSFSLQYWTPGMGIFVGTTNNNTKIDWILEGTIGQPTPSTNSSSPSPSTEPGNDTPQNGAIRDTFTSTLILVIAVAIAGRLVLP
ncbi:hypothetical protein BDZ94DRAFT_1259680 [Collybia nuda]|uniref:Deoxyribonuclease NucA/NucB domain-containing protein n=1 Tax=Collybia nuda TaxID=64659 RepID=A0A9P6CJT6_9AGAR|nr:hypothetical protein BDZ94DRAFT_1259680 [Collybia nuda]